MIRVFVTAVLLIGASAACGVTLENDDMRIVFGDESESFAVRKIVNKVAGGKEFMRPSKGLPGFWGLRFVRKEAGTNVAVHVSHSQPAEKRTVTVDGTTATFRWEGMSLPDSKGTYDVAARVCVPSGRGLSTWIVQVRNRSERWTLQRIQYPFLDCVVTADDPAAKVLAPAKGNVGGQLFPMSEYGKATKLFTHYYPSDQLQMAALMSGDAGVYFAAHDPECRTKGLTVAPCGTVWFETLVENAGVPGRAAETPGYEVKVGCFRGDWWTAAHIYRDWALRQKWCAKGKIATRGDFSKKAIDTHIWIIGGNTTNFATRTFAAMDRVWPDIGKNLTWSEWHYVGNGTATNRNNPEFFPAFQGTDVLSARESKAGYLTTLYINGRIWDKATCGFEYAKRDATMRDDGTLHDEIYHGCEFVNHVCHHVPYHFGVMCPWCPTWQKVQRDLACRCLDELHMDGVYFDQVSSAAPADCYDEAHGHPLGGGKWWTDGYRKMFTEIKREFVRRDNAVIVSEQMGEMWIDLIDVYLNATPYTKYDVPLCPAIYSGYMLHYGRPVPLDLPPDEAFREYARTLVWGEAFGWIVPFVPMREENRARADLIYRLACVRRDNKEFLALGTLEGEVSPLNPDPDVFGTFFRNAAGDAWAAALVNAARTEKAVRFRFPGSDSVCAVTLPAQTVKVERADAR